MARRQCQAAAFRFRQLLILVGFQRAAKAGLNPALQVDTTWTGHLNWNATVSGETVQRQEEHTGLQCRPSGTPRRTGIQEGKIYGLSA